MASTYLYLAQTSTSMPPLIVLLFLFLGWRFILGLVAVGVAERRGRSARWFWGGLFLGVLGIVIPMVVTDKKEKRHFRRQVSALARYAQYLEQKMDVISDSCHPDLGGPDESVNGQRSKSGTIEVPSKPEELDEIVSELITRWEKEAVHSDEDEGAAELAPPSERDLTEEWYVRDGGKEVGPISQYELKRLLSSGEIDIDAHVRTESMGSYKRAYDIEELLKVMPQE